MTRSCKFYEIYCRGNAEVKKHKMDLVDGVQGYFLLVAANLTPEHEYLVRATAQPTFVDIKDKVQKMFGEFGDPIAVTDGGGASTLPIKEESLYTKGYQQ